MYCTNDMKDLQALEARFKQFTCLKHVTDYYGNAPNNEFICDNVLKNCGQRLAL